MNAEANDLGDTRSWLNWDEEPWGGVQGSRSQDQPCRAVKTISLAGQPPEEEQEYRERFYREAEAAGRLSHPGIVTIFDVGEEPETRAPYIVMEFVGGQSLDRLLSGEDRKLPLETALQLTHELAEALDCAHVRE